MGFRRKGNYLSVGFIDWSGGIPGCPLGNTIGLSWSFTEEVVLAGGAFLTHIYCLSFSSGLVSA